MVTAQDWAAVAADLPPLQARYFQVGETLQILDLVVRHGYRSAEGAQRRAKRIAERREKNDTKGQQREPRLRLIPTE